MPGRRDGDKFLDLIDKESNPPHWMWGGAISKTSGYGVSRYASNQGQTSAHRAIYEYYIGPIPNGLNVLHRCDIKLCVNPDCLFLGTQSDNINDSVRKNRFRMNGVNTNQKGQCNNASKYTETQIMEVIQYLRDGRLTQRKIASITGVHFGTVNDIKMKKRWTHLW